MQKNILLTLVGPYVHRRFVFSFITFLAIVLVTGCTDKPQKPNNIVSAQDSTVKENGRAVYAADTNTFPEFWSLKLTHENLVTLLKISTQDVKKVIFQIVLNDGKFKLVARGGKNGRDVFTDEVLLDTAKKMSINLTTDQLVVSSLESVKDETLQILRDYRDAPGKPDIYLVPQGYYYSSTNKDYLRYTISTNALKVLNNESNSYNPESFYLNPSPPF
jgi:hypothetical protein